MVRLSAWTDVVLPALEAQHGAGDAATARECPRCRHGWQHGHRNVLIQPERGPWSGEWLWRCDCCGRTFYERDFR